MELGDLQNAKADLLLTINLDPNDPHSHYMLAEVYQKLNQLSDRLSDLDLFNKLSSAQKAKPTGDDEKRSAPSQGSHP